MLATHETENSQKRASTPIEESKQTESGKSIDDALKKSIKTRKNSHD